MSNFKMKYHDDLQIVAHLYVQLSLEMWFRRINIPRLYMLIDRALSTYALTAHTARFANFSLKWRPR